VSKELLYIAMFCTALLNSPHVLHQLRNQFRGVRPSDVEINYTTKEPTAFISHFNPTTVLCYE